MGPDQFLPLLDKIARQSAYLNMARERAAKLTAIFRDPPPRTAVKENGKAK